ncbi:MAG: hypothetical protein ACLUT3_06810 [Bifidobacterium bifidum]
MYYRRQKGNIGRLEDTTGCGNTFDFTNTHVVTFAVDSLRYWAKRIGIDGFRFDLGVSLARLDGDFTKHHPFLYALRSDLLLGNLKLIMEPWDLGPQGWRTGRIRHRRSASGTTDSATRCRQFWITDINQTAAPACDQHAGDGHAPVRFGRPVRHRARARDAASSINYVIAHDGFTLADLDPLRGQAQRSQRREQYRRIEREPLRELRCRGAVRRPGDHPQTRAGRHEHARHADAVAGHADDAGGRRIRQLAERQQQRLLRRTTTSPGSNWDWMQLHRANHAECTA